MLPVRLTPWEPEVLEALRATPATFPSRGNRRLDGPHEQHQVQREGGARWLHRDEPKV